MYDLLTEPWLHVVDMDGNLQSVGIKECLINAHKYRRLAENNDLAVIRRLQHRLLETLVICIYNIKNQDEYMELFRNGCFDKNKVNEYFETCENSGVSFDIFNEERPFLQTDKKTFESVFKNSKKKPVSVASINPKMSSGNNKVFFNYVSPDDYINIANAKDERLSCYDDMYDKKHHIEDGFEISFEEYANLLLIHQCIAGQGGTGYRTGLMCKGSPPVLYHIDITGENENLFNTIMLNVYAINRDDNTNKKLGHPMWEWASYMDGYNCINSETENITYLMGMFFPVLYLYPDLSSIDVESKKIRKIYKSNIVFDDTAINNASQFWITNFEPSIAVQKIKSPKNCDIFYTGITFSENNRSWLDIRSYANCVDFNQDITLNGNKISDNVINALAPKVLSQLNLNIQLEKRFSIELIAYYLFMEQAKYMAQGKYQCFLPCCILEDIEKKKIIFDFISYTETCGKTLQSDISNIYKNINLEKEKPVVLDVFNRFMRKSEYIFKNEFISEINNAFDCQQLNLILDNYKKKISKLKLDLLNNIPIPNAKIILAEKEFAKLRGGYEYMMDDVLYRSFSLDDMKSLFERVAALQPYHKMKLKNLYGENFEDLPALEYGIVLRVVDEMKQFWTLPEYKKNFLLNMISLYIRQDCKNGKNFEKCLGEIYLAGNTGVQESISYFVSEDGKDFVVDMERYLQIFSNDSNINVVKLTCDVLNLNKLIKREWRNSILNIKEIKKEN